MVRKALDAGKQMGVNVAATGVRMGVEAAKPHVQSAVVEALGTASDVLSGKPNEKKLKRRVAYLQERLGIVSEEARHLDATVAELKKALKACGAKQVVRKAKLIHDLQRPLILQYGFTDYIELMLGVLEGSASFHLGATRFYHAYGSYLDTKELSDRDYEHLRDYVLAEHKFDVRLMNVQPTKRALRRLERFELGD